MMKLKDRKNWKNIFLAGNFDSPTEKYLFERLQAVDFEQFGYELRPKLVFKRYTLDFALLGKNRIDIECDGTQHEIIEGFPVIEDVERDDFLTREGWKVLRFPNHRVLSQTEAVIEQILKNL
jgi:very-short-patch-repair endonuclease